MESRLSGHDLGFDGADDDGEDSSPPAPAVYLQDLSSEPAMQVEAANWAEHNETRLYAALETLDERSRDIVRQRWLSEEKATLQTLAERYQVSAERIRQLENNAIRKLQQSLQP
ncbi:MAG: sigma-70 family RNA polymerase sigma factor, partial [Pseudomonadota bacterium]